MKQNREIIERYKAVKAMHELVQAINDEEAYYEHWVNLVPDCPEEEDFTDIAEDKELFKEVCDCFREIIKDYGESGFYIGEELY